MFVFVFYIKPNEKKPSEKIQQTETQRIRLTHTHTHSHTPRHTHSYIHTHTDTFRQGKANRNFGTCVQHQREIR